MSLVQSVELVRLVVALQSHDLVRAMRAGALDLPADLEQRLGLPPLEWLRGRLDEIVDGDQRLPARELFAGANPDLRKQYPVLDAVNLDGLAASVVQILKIGSDLTERSDGFAMERGPLKLCPGERFEHEIGFRSPACASGFLVAADLIATAKHVVDGGAPDLAAIFTEPEGLTDILPAARVIRLKTASAYYPPSTEEGDWALVRLDLAPNQLDPSRRPVVLAAGPGPAAGDEVFSLGHPNGLPMILSPQGSVMPDQDAAMFKVDLDTSGGSSGSLVANASGEVVGLIRRTGLSVLDDGCKRWLEIQLGKLAGRPVLTTVVKSALFRDIVETYRASGKFPGE
jgi:Trypsin-like peptidase domain